MSAEQQIRNLAIGRIVIGVLSYAFPNLAGKLFGISSAANPQAPYLARLFGIRDIALGLGTLQSTGEARKQWLRVGVLCDAADAAAAVAGRQGGYLSTPSAVLLAAPAVTATALGASALQAPVEPS